MADRFANGDPGNDSVASLVERANRADPDGRHGGDLAGVRARLDYIAGLGFTQLWLNPILESNQPRGSYHGYAITDFYRVDPRLGDNALFATLGAEARSRGVGLVMDVVLNHCGSRHWWMADLPDPDWINHGEEFVGTTHRRETHGRSRRPSSIRCCPPTTASRPRPMPRASSCAKWASTAG